MASEEERLYYAVQMNDPSCLNRLIADGVDINNIFTGMICVTGRPHKWSALHLCCEKGSYECAKILLEAGADPDPQDKWNLTPLMYSIQTQWLNLVELLIRYGAGMDIQDRKGRSPVHFAIECSDTRCLETLISSGANPDIRDMLGRTPLWHVSSTEERFEFAQLLVNSGRCDVNCQDVREQRTPLQAAIAHTRKDRMKYARLFLQSGVDVNIRDTRNHTALMNVIVKSWNDGCEINEEDLELVHCILDCGYKINDIPEKKYWNMYGGSVLNMAVERGAAKLVKALLEHGADPNLTDADGMGPLFAAASHNKLTVAALLIQENCDLDLVALVHTSRDTSERMTPIKCTVIKCYWEFTTLLVDAGCDLKNLNFLWRTEDVPVSLVEDCDMWLWLRENAMNPKMLTVLCRDKIRHTLGLGLTGKTQVLDIPGYLVDLIEMKNILQPYLRCLQ